MCHRWCSRCLHVFSAMPSAVSKCTDRAISTSSMWFLKPDANRLLSSNNDYRYSGCQSGNRYIYIHFNRYTFHYTTDVYTILYNEWIPIINTCHNECSLDIFIHYKLILYKDIKISNNI